MRAIKFRIWNCHGKVMHQWSELVEKNKIHLLAYQQPSYPVMQFTGLHDKYGVEVYEGDVVSVDGSGVCEVKICPYWGVVYVDSDGYERQHADCVSEQDYHTVIGNIHETPELLK